MAQPQSASRLSKRLDGQSCVTTSSKRLRTSLYYPDVDAAVGKWLTDEEDERRRLVADEEIRKKALFFALKLNHHEFRASNRWLGDFKKQYYSSLGLVVEDTSRQQRSLRQNDANGDAFMQDEDVSGALSQEVVDEEDNYTGNDIIETNLIGEGEQHENVSPSNAHHSQQQQQSQQTNRRRATNTSTAAGAATTTLGVNGAVGGIHHINNQDVDDEDLFFGTSIWQTDPTEWTCEDVYEFVTNLVGNEIANQFKWHEIDGAALNYLRVDNLVSSMLIKLGPAAKIKCSYDKVKADFLESRNSRQN